MSTESAARKAAKEFMGRTRELWKRWRNRQVVAGYWSEDQIIEFAAFVASDVHTTAAACQKVAPPPVCPKCGGNNFWLQCNNARCDFDLDGEGAAQFFKPAPSPPQFTCAARKQGTAGGNDPADCNWPFCGCDPKANKVLEAIQESGFEIVPAKEAHRPGRTKLLMKFWTAMHLAGFSKDKEWDAQEKIHIKDLAQLMTVPPVASPQGESK